MTTSSRFSTRRRLLAALPWLASSPLAAAAPGAWAAPSSAAPSTAAAGAAVSANAEASPASAGVSAPTVLPAPARRAKLVLAGPPSSVSNPLLRIVASGALGHVADEVSFMLWSNPDQLRALAQGGQADFIAVPSNVAANLYNRGVPLRLVNVSIWGILAMVSRNSGMKTLADFQGLEIAMPFRADMPDLLFGFLAEKQGLDPRKDFKLRYVASPIEAMQLLILRQVDHALLAEPAISMALRKTRSFPISVVAPELYRSVALQDEWGRLLHREPRIPQAGMAALGAVRDDAALLAAFEQAYAQAAGWCEQSPDECGEVVARRIDMLTPEAVADSLRAQPHHLASAARARPELEYFYELLLQRQPASVGGKLPDAAFYGMPA